MEIWVLIRRPGGGWRFFIILLLILWGLGALFRWASHNWGLVSFILGSAVIMLVLIRTMMKYENLPGNIKAHGGAFSIFWWLGTAVLLISGYFIRKLTFIDDSGSFKLLFGIILCIIGIIAGAIIGGRLAEYEVYDAGSGAAFGALWFAVLFSIIYIFFITTSDADFGNKLFMGIFGGIIMAPIVGAVIGAVVGAILGSIGSGVLIGGLLGIIAGGGLGVLLSVFLYGMLASTSHGALGALGAAELVLAASFGLFNKFSPADPDTYGDGRGVCLAWILLTALPVGILVFIYLS